MRSHHHYPPYQAPPSQHQQSPYASQHSLLTVHRSFSKSAPLSSLTSQQRTHVIHGSHNQSSERILPRIPSPQSQYERDSRAQQHHPRTLRMMELLNGSHAEKSASEMKEYSHHPEQPTFSTVPMFTHTTSVSPRRRIYGAQHKRTVPRQISASPPPPATSAATSAATRASQQKYILDWIGSEECTLVQSKLEAQSTDVENQQQEEAKSEQALITTHFTTLLSLPTYTASLPLSLLHTLKTLQKFACLSFPSLSALLEELVHVHKRKGEMVEWMRNSSTAHSASSSSQHQQQQKIFTSTSPYILLLDEISLDRIVLETEIWKLGKYEAGLRVQEQQADIADSKQDQPSIMMSPLQPYEDLFHILHQLNQDALDEEREQKRAKNHIHNQHNNPYRTYHQIDTTLMSDKKGIYYLSELIGEVKEIVDRAREEAGILDSENDDDQVKSSKNRSISPKRNGQAASSKHGNATPAVADDHSSSASSTAVASARASPTKMKPTTTLSPSPSASAAKLSTHNNSHTSSSSTSSLRSSLLRLLSFGTLVPLSSLSLHGVDKDIDDLTRLLETRVRNEWRIKQEAVMRSKSLKELHGSVLSPRSLSESSTIGTTTTASSSSNGGIEDRLDSHSAAMSLIHRMIRTGGGKKYESVAEVVREMKREKNIEEQGEEKQQQHRHHSLHHPSVAPPKHKTSSYRSHHSSSTPSSQQHQHQAYVHQRMQSPMLLANPNDAHVDSPAAAESTTASASVTEDQDSSFPSSIDSSRRQAILTYLTTSPGCTLIYPQPPLSILERDIQQEKVRIDTLGKMMDLMGVMSMTAIGAAVVASGNDAAASSTTTPSPPQHATFSSYREILHYLQDRSIDSFAALCHAVKEFFDEEENRQQLNDEEEEESPYPQQHQTPLLSSPPSQDEIERLLAECGTGFSTMKYLRRLKEECDDMDDESNKLPKTEDTTTTNNPSSRFPSLDLLIKEIKKRHITGVSERRKKVVEYHIPYSSPRHNKQQASDSAFGVAGGSDDVTLSLSSISPISTLQVTSSIASHDIEPDGWKEGDVWVRADVVPQTVDAEAVDDVNDVRVTEIQQDQQLQQDTVVDNQPSVLVPDHALIVTELEIEASIEPKKGQKEESKPESAATSLVEIPVSQTIVVEVDSTTASSSAAPLLEIHLPTVSPDSESALALRAAQRREKRSSQRVNLAEVRESGILMTKMQQPGAILTLGETKADAQATLAKSHRRRDLNRSMSLNVPLATLMAPDTLNAASADASIISLTDTTTRKRNQRATLAATSDGLSLADHVKRAASLRAQAAQKERDVVKTQVPEPVMEVNEEMIKSPRADGENATTTDPTSDPLALEASSILPSGSSIAMPSTPSPTATPGDETAQRRRAKRATQPIAQLRDHVLSVKGGKGSAAMMGDESKKETEKEDTKKTAAGEVTEQVIPFDIPVITDSTSSTSNSDATATELQRRRAKRATQKVNPQQAAEQLNRVLAESPAQAV